MKTLKITIICCLLSSFTFAQTVHTVDNRAQSGAQFTDLQAAIDAAVAGDIIQVHPSPNTYGSVTINKTLTLVGLGHNPVITNGETATLSSISFIGNSGGSEIKGLRFTSIANGTSSNSTNLDAIHIRNNYISSTITGSSTPGMTDDWIVEGNYMIATANAIIPQIGSNNWQMKNNFMRGRFSSVNNTGIITNNIILTTLNSFSFFNNCNGPLVNNNIFLATGNLTEIGISGSTIDFVSNMTFNSGGLTIDPLAGTNNLDNTDPQFANITAGVYTDFYNNDYSLDAGSPGINAGSDGTDIGLYGNNFTFDNNGRPNLMPYPENINITNSVIAPGQNLNVEFSAAQKQ